MKGKSLSITHEGLKIKGWDPTQPQDKWPDDMFAFLRSMDFDTDREILHKASPGGMGIILFQEQI